jgi:hypothetical protein
MQASSAKTRLGDRESLTFPTEKMIGRNPNAVVANVCVSSMTFVFLANANVSNNFNPR